MIGAGAFCLPSEGGFLLRSFIFFSYGELLLFFALQYGVPFGGVFLGERRGVRKSPLRILIVLGQNIASILPKTFLFFSQKLGRILGGNKKFFTEQILFHSARGCSSLLWRSFRRSLKFLLNLSLLNSYSTVNCEVVMTDFARWVNMKNARFCNVFDRFCKIFFCLSTLPLLTRKQRSCRSRN